MAENVTSKQETEDMGAPVVWVSFCPDLGLYHCHREVDGEDPADEKLTRDELEAMVEGMMKAGQIGQIQQLVELCAWARLFSHRVVVFYTSGSFRICKPLPPEAPEKEDNEFMKDFFAQWEKDHPTEESIPTVVPFKKKA